jgi:hypothetical protein
MSERTNTLRLRPPRVFLGRLRPGRSPEPAFEHVPTPPSEHVHWLVAGALALLGAALLAAVLSGLIGGAQPAPATPPPVFVAAVTPAPASSAASVSAGASRSVGGSGGAGSIASPSSSALDAASRHAAIVARPSASEQSEALARLESPLQSYVSTRWLEGFYPIYSVAQSTFGVNWLLIASIHDQETAFSTAPSTYHGLNFAGCCGGPMQFNVTNGRARAPSTWDLVSDSYLYGRRPATYNHMTARHPSIYDDFDAIMAGAHLLSADGAKLALDQGAWDAAYDYYGHDSYGVTYADQVLARAIGWSQHGFCPNCGLEPALVSAVYAAWGAPVLAALQAEEAAAVQALKRRRPAKAARPRHGR